MCNYLKMILKLRTRVLWLSGSGDKVKTDFGHPTKLNVNLAGIFHFTKSQFVQNPLDEKIWFSLKSIFVN